MNKKTNFLKITVLLVTLTIGFSMILSAAGCSKLDIEIFGAKIGESDENPLQDKDHAAIKEEANSEDYNDPQAASANESTQDSSDITCGDNNTSQENNYYPYIDMENERYKSNGLEISKQREYFQEGLEHFQDGSYLLAEYYFNKIKDDYLMLQDHVLYYLAKSLLMQEKFDTAEEHYSKLIQFFPDSIWAEKSNLEYADLFFLKNDYVTAEEEYNNFFNNFHNSDYIPYCLFQLAACKEKNEKYASAYENYKEIWLQYPTSEYSQKAPDSLDRLAEENSMEVFIPSAEQIYNRGEIFFSFYSYNSAIEEFDKILGENYVSSLSSRLYSKTLFKKGMCYYNLRDYDKSKSYLSLCYEKFPSSSVADDSLYFLGRVFTNLDMDDKATTYYQNLLNKFPQSNYSDDALYRLGRIYFFRDDFQNASLSYKRIINEYPNGDKLPESYWELGWVQYISGDWSSSKNTFRDMATSFSGTSLEEKALFWQAKCCQKLGDDDEAEGLYKKIISMNSYSYYTFTSSGLLTKLHSEARIPKINASMRPCNPGIADLIPDVYSNLEPGKIESYKDITHIEKAKELLKLEYRISASLEIEAGSKELSEDPIKILGVSTLFLQAEDYINSQKLISRYHTKLKSTLTGSYRDYFYYLNYPYGYGNHVDYYSRQHNLDPLFTLAVIREESRFQPDVGSFAGALGLMQIIPSTGQSIAKQMGIPNFDNSMLLDSETNIKMGTFYLRQQLDNFNQNKFYTCGAYNGGPGNMSKWISRWGDRDMDEFIENIPYDETRNYIKKVMGSYYFYQMLYK
jgi:soluble lytic murein transglycosylase